MTADGSILVLAKYMIKKIEEKPDFGGEFWLTLIWYI